MKANTHVAARFVQKSLSTTGRDRQVSFATRTASSMPPPEMLLSTRRLNSCYGAAICFPDEFFLAELRNNTLCERIESSNAATVVPPPPSLTGLRDNHGRGKAGDFLKEKIAPGSALSFVSAIRLFYRPRLPNEAE